MPIVDRAENILALLKMEPRLRIGEISIIGYSFGRLIAKQILRTAQTKAPQDEIIAGLSRRICRVGFLATPHHGSDSATWAKRLGAIGRPSPSASDLVRNSPNLRELNIWYRHYAANNNVESLVLIETRRTGLWGHVVKH
jgi:hypothetical protein